MAQASEEAAEEQRKAIYDLIQSKRYLEDLSMIPWYTKELNELEPDTNDLFETYCKLPSTDIKAHISRVYDKRDKAFKIFPYPCLGQWGFLKLSISKSPCFDEIVRRLKGGDRLLDIGCCLGQDIRKLVHAGAPSSNIYASDKQNFWDIAYDLFLDRSTLRTQFIEADIFDSDSALQQLDGQISLVNAAAFFHLFDWNGQVKAATRLVRLLKAESNNLIIGRQVGRADAGDFKHSRDGASSFWHNVESFERMWKQIGEETESQWEVKAALGDVDLTKKLRACHVPSGARPLTFTVRRL